MILYLAADLLWASKIKATADALGIPCRPVRTMDMLTARLAEATPEHPVHGLLLDLDKPDEALAMIAHVKDPARLAAQPHMARIKVLAWGPHVARELLQSARAAGADDVLTRGAMDHHLEDILLKLAGRA